MKKETPEQIVNQTLEAIARYRLPVKDPKKTQKINHPITPPVNYDRTTQRGRESEENAANAIRKLFMVSNVTRISANGQQDKLGLDMSVELRRSSYRYPFDHVFVQVKSSNKGIREYRKMIKKRYHLDQNDYDEWLLKNRMIILNAQNMEQQINIDFLSQLQKILSYYLLHPSMPLSRPRPTR